MPQLSNIRLFWALTTTGSPWWVVHLYMGNPVRRLLKRGIAAFCSKRLDFRMLNPVATWIGSAKPGVSPTSLASGMPWPPFRSDLTNPQYLIRNQFG